MAGMLGMDIEQVKTVAREVEREAAELQATINNIGTKITEAAWKGQDRESFVSEWTSHRAKVTKVVESLRRTAQDMKKHAHEQEATSNG